MYPMLALAIVWLGFIISWIVAARWTARTETRVGVGRRLPDRVLVVAGAVLLALPPLQVPGVVPIWRLSGAGLWACAAVAALGIGFAWWARLHLGRLWSSAITRKAGHHVVASGPYGIVRHPIYTGLLLAVLATAIAKATPAGLLAVALFAAGFWWKARLEEHWLARELPEGDYAAYRRRVPMLLPLGPRGA